MLRRDGLLFLLLFFSLFIQSKGITLVGRVSNPAIKQLYVFSVYDEQNVYLLPLDSIRVVDHDFKYHNDYVEISAALYYPCFREERCGGCLFARLLYLSF